MYSKQKKLDEASLKQRAEETAHLNSKQADLHWHFYETSRYHSLTSVDVAAVTLTGILVYRLQVYA
jgi:hypothetical protein